MSLEHVPPIERVAPDDHEKAADAPVYDSVIVGGGPAGLAAAMFAGLRGLRAITLEANQLGGQLVNLYPSKPVTNFPGVGELDSGELAKRLANQAAHFGAELLENEPVESIARTDSKFLVRTPKRRLAGRTVVLAMGLGRFAPRRLGLKDEPRYQGRGVIYALPPKEEITARRAVIVGGGDSAVDTALALEHVVPEVTLIHRRCSFRALAHSVERLANSRVRVLTNGEILELRGNGVLEGVLVSVESREVVDLPTDLLLVSIGQVPDLNSLANWEIQLPLEQAKLRVASDMRSNASQGLFAAGDFAHYDGKVKLIATAVAEGSTAISSASRYLAH